MRYDSNVLEYYPFRFKDNLPLNKEETYESTLKLTGLSSADAGSYQCRARNKFGAAFSETAELKIVPGKLTFQIDANKRIFRCL